MNISTTTEARRDRDRDKARSPARPFWRAARNVAIGACVALAAWVAILAAATAMQPPGQPVAVLSPAGTATALAAVTRAGGRIMAVRGNSVIAVSDAPGFVRRLYGEGLLLVVPARPAGCGFGRIGTLFDT